MPKPLESLGDVLARVKANAAMDREYAYNLRQPKGVGKSKWGLSATKASGEPMLNAKPDSITRGLLYKEPTHKSRNARGPMVKTIVVKPNCLQTARYKNPGGFWGERAWNIYTLKWCPGFIVVTDRGDESPKFDSIGQLRKAVMQSGWDVLRNA